MLGRIGPTPREFCDAVVSSYSKTRAMFPDVERWRQVRAQSTTQLWMALPSENHLLPEETQLSVLGRTAASLKLTYAAREQLRLDAIFSVKETWFPIVVAIESEIVYGTFEQEIKKLLSVRCPLKVGMTGFDTSEREEKRRLLAIEEMIKVNFNQISEIIEEAPATEYLFLVDVELNIQKEISRWYSLDFQASDGPQGRTFQLIDSSNEHRRGVA
jgi:hypothetical protein